MARGLYRVYLYTVTILLLVFATVSVGMLLGDALRLTPLRGPDTPPTGAELAQSGVLAVVTLLIVAALGGLHYWLIRRDTASDPQPGASGVRAFTLNLAEAIASLVAVFTGASAVTALGQPYQSDSSAVFAAALAALGLALALEWERRRAPATGGAALIFQRLRLDTLGLIFAFTTFGYLYSAVNTTQQAIGQASGVLACGAVPATGPANPYYQPPCVGSELAGAWGAALVALAAWLLALRLADGGRRMLLRQIALLLGFAGGVAFLIYALERAVAYLLALATQTAQTGQPDYLNDYNFGPVLVGAAVLLAVYGWKLRPGAPQEPLGAPATRLTQRAIAAALFAIPFWVGLDRLIATGLRLAIPASGAVPTTQEWVDALALAVAGLAYIPLALWLGAGSRAEGVGGPRRGFTLALLAAGALVTAGAAATLIYTLATAALGVALDNWHAVAREAGAALVVGLALGGLYLWISAREGQFARPSHPQPQPTAGATAASAPAAAPAAEAAVGDVSGLEGLLAEVRAGTLAPAEAAARIRALAEAGALR